jgi:hypothetical protein
LAVLSWQFAVGQKTIACFKSTNCKPHVELSGRPGSNWPPEAWKATALPNELLPLVNLQICRYAHVQIIKRTTIQNLHIGTFAYLHIEFLWAE